MTIISEASRFECHRLDIAHPKFVEQTFQGLLTLALGALAGPTGSDDNDVMHRHRRNRLGNQQAAFVVFAVPAHLDLLRQSEIRNAGANAVKHRLVAYRRGQNIDAWITALVR
ncbi:MAG TPA: hypothetical protein VHA53_05680 [Nitrolancea sp.]|nr:hypothetical protein [Nitrolancea sp.]